MKLDMRAFSFPCIDILQQKDDMMGILVSKCPLKGMKYALQEHLTR